MIMLAILFIACMRFVLESGWMLVCRTQAQAVAESAALGGARSWGAAATNDATTRSAAKTRAIELVVNSQISGLTTEYANLQTDLQNSNNTAGTNNNLAGCPAATVTTNQVILGDINSATLVFSPQVVPATAGQFQLVATSPITNTSRTVSARATAFWDASASPNRSRLAFVTISCP
jgi:hypothetical protein